MADVHALMSLADGLATRLRAAYPAALNDAHPARFLALSSGALSQGAPALNSDTLVSIWPYKVGISEHLRNREFRLPAQQLNRPLSLDVHLLVTVWSTTVHDELLLFAWTLRELDRLSLLDASVLAGGVDAQWRPDEQVQLQPVEMSLEDLLRLWEGLAPKYRLSMPYVARVLQLDEISTEGRPVVAQRLRLQDVVEGRP